jgi:hypothetical protein
MQLQGMLKGYNKSVELSLKSGKDLKYPIKYLKIEDLLLVQVDGEIPELMRFMQYRRSVNTYDVRNRKDFERIFRIKSDDPKTIWKRLMWRSRCSAYIKLLKNEDNEITQLYTGHNAWTEFTETLRTYKHYKLDFYDDLNSLSLKTEVTFSSYAGAIGSTDDYYITDKKLFVTETTLEVIDMNAYRQVKTASNFIPNFMRINAASFFSNTSEEWTKNFSFFNSGTYSSQWMIIDYKVFDKIKGQKADEVKDEDLKGLFSVLEQVPNKIVVHDISNKLIENGYFASFNKIFFSETKESVNEDLVRELYGEYLTSKGQERAKIFKFLNKNVKNFKDFKNVMRYNGFKLNRKDFPDDPSNNNPGFGISSRYDLDKEYYLSGGIDCKITNDKLVSDLSSAIISGPTNENNENLSTFSWDNVDRNTVSTIGLPNKYDFKWLLANPKNIRENNDDDNYEF